MDDLISLFFSCCLAGAVALSSIPVFAATSDEAKMTDNTHALMVKHNNPVFTIRLASKPGQPIQWFLIDDKVLSFAWIKQRTIKMDEDNAYEEWSFKLNRSAFRYPHIAQLRFVYTSPDEMSPHVWNEMDQKVFTVAIVS